MTKTANKHTKRKEKLLDKCIEVDVYIDEVRHFAGANNKQHTKSFIEKVIQNTKKSIMDIEKIIGEIDEV